MKAFVRIIAMLFVVWAGYQSSCAWTEFYGKRIDRRFNQFLAEQSDSDRSPAAKWGNAELGVALEYNGALLGIALAGFGIVAVVWHVSKQIR